MKKNLIYHACRMAFICGEEKVPWHLVCHAIRQGLELKSKTYILQDKDYKKYPQLKELVEWMRGARTQETEREATRILNEQLSWARHGIDVGNQQRPVRSGTKPNKANCK